MNDEYLCFVNCVGKDVDNIYTYEFLFTDDPDTFWNEDFDVKPLGLCSKIHIDERTYTSKVTFKTTIKLDVIQENCCFSMQDCMDGVVSLAHENIDDYDEYPDDGRLVLMYGEKYDDVIKKLAERNILLG